MSNLSSASMSVEPAISNATLRRIQAISGCFFFVFLILHISNTLVASAGHEAYNAYQNFLRAFYNHPVFELVFVIFPLIIHAVAGVVMYQRQGARKASFLARLQTWSGFLLLTIIFGHIAATRGIGLVMDAAPSFEGVSFSLWWMPAIFYPYYFILFMAGLYHGSNGLMLALDRLGVWRVTASTKLKLAFLAVGSVSCIVALLAFGGHLRPIPDPTDNAYAKAYSSIFGIRLPSTEN